MIQTPTPTSSTSVSAIQLVKIIIPIIGGSLATLIGTVFQRYLNEYDETISLLYSPLLDRVSEFAKGNIQFEADNLEIVGVWEGIDRYRRHNLDSQTKSAVEETQNDIQKLEIYLRHLKDGIAEECTYTNVLEGSKGPYPSISFKKRGGHTSYYVLDRWIREYYKPVLEATDPSELKQLLIERGTEMGGVYSNTFYDWDDRDFVNLYSAVEKTDEKLSDFSDYDHSEELFNSIKTSSGELETKFAEKVSNRGFIGYLMKRIP